MPKNIRIKRALLSVTDKTGISELASALNKAGIEMISTGGTAKAIQAEGFKVIEVQEVTDFPEMMGGRLKTLHPRIFGGILQRRNDKGDSKSAIEHKIPAIDLVVVNLYQFAKKAAEKGVTPQEVIESIDIGGPSLIRAAAKNWQDVCVLTSPSQYAEFIDELKQSDGISSATRLKFASEAFAHTAEYDAMIAHWFSKNTTQDDDSMPKSIHLNLKQNQAMRYGENPHQNAAFYTLAGEETVGVQACKQLHGKELSFNNLIDADIALALPSEFDDPCVAILKHTTPSGVGTGENIAEAEARARACDPLSAFGGIVGMNRICDAETAKQINKAFTEVVVAPGYTDEALALLKKKKNLRILSYPETSLHQKGFDYRRINGGLLVQQKDQRFPELESAKVVTSRQPSDVEWRALHFAWKVVKYVKSNAILFAKDGQTLGIGAGQMSRVDAARIARMKADDVKFDLSGSVVASDAFFPFADGVEQAVEAGAVAIIQPGGSVRDEEVIKAADKHNVAMVMTGRRHFRHS